MTENTHFGFREVPEREKSRLVGDVFRSVAGRYDLMNDLMSFGAHRLWKQFTLLQSGVRPGQQVLDVAAGTGDLSIGFARRLQNKGRLVVSDINSAMLARGRERLVDAGIVGNISFVLADAERLPFPDDYFDCISIGFGLRNVTRQDEALKSMFRCLRPGGRLLVLEFSRPVSKLLRGAYEAYSFNVLPRMGRLVAGDEGAYRYLVESIRKHPDQLALKQMMEQVGFERVDYHNLTGGIVALHTGYKL